MMFFSPKRSTFLSVCETYSELPSNISTMTIFMLQYELCPDLLELGWQGHSMPTYKRGVFAYYCGSGAHCRKLRGFQCIDML